MMIFVVAAWLVICLGHFKHDMAYGHNVSAVDESRISVTLKEFSNEGQSCVMEIDVAALAAANPESLHDMPVFPPMDPECALVRVIAKTTTDTPVPDAIVRRRGALFVCLGGDNFDKYLHHMRFQTLQKLLFAEIFHYNFYIYFRPNSLPGYTAQYHRVPAFLRIFRLGHPWAMYVDMDTFQLFESSVRLEAFMRKDINLNADVPLCSGVIGMRNTQWSLDFLSSWWDLAGDDQAAMSYLLVGELQPFTSFPILFKFDTQVVNLRNRWSHVEEIPRVQNHSHIHFIGPGFKFVQPDIPRVREKHLAIEAPIVQLHNCLGNWPGCSDAAASFYHTGSFRWFWPHRLVHNETITWLNQYQQFRYSNGLD